jgi:hypothetical protein
VMIDAVLSVVSPIQPVSFTGVVAMKRLLWICPRTTTRCTKCSEYYVLVPDDRLRGTSGTKSILYTKISYTEYYSPEWPWYVRNKVL